MIEQTLTVGEDGLVPLRVCLPAGMQVRVIVLDAWNEASEPSAALARLQENSGFARAVLADPAEDVWNDL